jgi:hypothetical protein
MFVERRELTVEQRIAMMTDEQRLEEAGKLADRIRRRLDENRHLIEGEATEVGGGLRGATTRRRVR